MKDNKNNEDYNFTTSNSFQKSIKKAKRKQTLKYFIISLISTLIFLFALYQGAFYNLQKKLDYSEDDLLFSLINGANTQRGDVSYDYVFLKANSNISIEKIMGDRTIIWNELKEEIPAFGKENFNESNRFTQQIQFNELFNRKVQYNTFNGEREVAFYYPQLEYEFLPNELAIATKLDNNTLVEVALSFDKSYSVKEIQEIVGENNVTWLWVNTTRQISDNSQAETTLNGASADGFHYWGGDYTSSAKAFLTNLKQLGTKGKYQKVAQKMIDGINRDSFPEVSDLSITGVVLTGTPTELEAFENLELVRASTIGATIDLY